MWMENKNENDFRKKLKKVLQYTVPGYIITLKIPIGGIKAAFEESR